MTYSFLIHFLVPPPFCLKKIFLFLQLFGAPFYLLDGMLLIHELKNYANLNFKLLGSTVLFKKNTVKVLMAKNCTLHNG